MSRFNPNLEKSPQEWGAIALKDNLSDRSGHLVVAGIVGGGLLASATTPLLGAVFAAYLITKGIQNAIVSDKNKNLITHSGCVAHVLKPSDFRAYRRQVGDEKVMSELQFVEREGMPLSVDAWEFLEEFVTRIEQEQSSKHPLSETVGTETINRAIDVPSKAIIDRYDPKATAKIDIISEMISRISNTLIIGIPGSGKGMLVANAIRVAKRLHPNLKVFVIDPKADPKESGYFASCDVVKAYACMDANPSTVAAWAEATFNSYTQYAQQNERTLLIVDEGTLLGTKLNQAKSTLLVDKLTSLASGGDSAGRNVWFMMQSPYVTGASLNLSTTSQMTSIVIAFSENIGALAQWKSAKVFQQLSLDEVSDKIDNSETGRAIYYGKTGKWYMMPPLTNYSGYDRDNRTYLAGFSPEDSVIEKVESNHKDDGILSGDRQIVDKPQLSESAQLVIEWLKEKRPKQWVKFKGKDDRDMTFIKFLSEKSINVEKRNDVIQELVNAEVVEISPDESYLRVT